MRQKETIEFRYYEVPPGFPLIALMGEKWEIPYGTDSMHFHNYLEIGICRYGEGTMYLGKETVPYSAGTITVIPKDFPHHTKGIDENIQKWEYLFVDTENFLADVYPERLHYVDKLLKRLHSRMFLMREEEHPDISMVLNMIFKEMEQQEEFYRENVCSLLLVLLLKIIQINKQGEMTNDQLKNSMNFSNIVDVLQYINKNYAEELRIGDLAKMENMSETHFRRVFAECMDASPVEYINFIRIEKACELMRKSDERIEDIAVKVGFPVFSTFSRNFKRITGCSPMQWKSRLKKEGNVLADYKVSVRKGW